MPDAISTAVGSIFYRHPEATISLADALREADFVAEPFLRLERLRIAAAPEVDTATFTYEYGTVRQPEGGDFDDFTRLDLDGMFVKVEIEETAGSGADPLVWYGIIEGTADEVHGTRDTVPTGVQTFVAYGLLRLAEKTIVRRSVVEDTTDTSIEIARGLPFNIDPGGSYPRRGNRSDAEVSSRYIFSETQRGASEWDAYQAVKYLLDVHAPRSGDFFGDNKANVWELADGVDPGFLDWYDITVQTDGRTLKAVLDDLIPRYRGVGYFAKFDPSDDSVKLHVFTMVETDLTLPSGATLKANANQKTLDFEQAFDIESAIVRDMGTARYNTVIARGARRTTTGTFPLDENDAYKAFIPDWTTEGSSSEEDDYIIGASEQVGYSDLNEDEQARLNAIARTDERLRHVFRRWKLNHEWNKRLFSPHDTDLTEYLVSPTYIEGAAIDPVYEDGVTEGEPVWIQGMRIRRTLPLLDRYDYADDRIEAETYDYLLTILDQPRFIEPFVYARVKVATDTTPAEYQFLDKLAESAMDGEDSRRWSAGLRIIDEEPALEIVANPSHMLARQEFEEGSWPATAEEHDPVSQNGIDWRDIWATLCVELDEHIEAVETIDAPATHAPVKTLLISVPDARHDYVLPQTVVGIEYGRVKKTDGGLARDDTDRLRDICRSAATWYGNRRQTLQITYRQVRGLFSLGWLITEFGSVQKTGINTAITAIEYDMGRGSSVGTTTVETSFAQLDLFG